MLFLYRPRQTWMPYRLPRDVTQQDAYNQHMQEKFDATIRVPRPTPADVTATGPATGTVTALTQLGELHASGVLSDSEFAAAKARAIGTGEPPA